MSNSTDTDGMLAQQQCKSYSNSDAPLNPNRVSEFINQLDGWTQHGMAIEKSFKFDNHYQATSFVNAVAWISHRQDHHPEIVIGYNKCTVEYTTHAVNGLSKNDFICAAKVDALLKV
jgi:4a-hydroxytetrahydrobiopterin dehydratase